MDVITDSPITRVRKSVEAIIRPAFYQLLKLFFDNPPPATKLDCRTIKSLLVIPYGDAIGDLILATPIWNAVKRRNPGCKIGVLSSERNESLLRADGGVDAHYRFENRRDFKHLSEFKRARKADYEVVLNLHWMHLSDYGLIANFAAPRAIKITADHERRDKYRLLFNHIGRRTRDTTHLSIHSLELLSEAVEFDPPLTLSECWPRISIPDEAEQLVADRVREHMPSGCTSYIILHLQAGTAFREWGIANARELSERLTNRYPTLTVFLTAAPNTLSLAVDELPRDRSSHIQFFQTSSDLLELAALVRNASLVITPETSLIHFASAMKTPVILLTSNRLRPPIEWLPLATISRLLAPAQAGSPVQTIPVEEVFSAACSMLDGTWRQSQTCLDSATEQDPMYQSESGDRLLSEFQNTVWSAVE